MTTVASKKRLDVIACARTLFLSNGYQATSMDRIAQEAGVSKRTVYKHFADKSTLFGAVVDGLYHDILASADPVPADDVPIGAALDRFARQLLQSARRPSVVALLRLVIAEGRHEPSLAERFYAHGKKRTLDRLAGLIRDRTEAGELAVDDPRLAALQFLGSLKEITFWPMVLNTPPLYGDDEAIGRAVELFLSRYGTGRETRHE